MAQARTEFAAALNQIASEKGVEVEVVLDAIRLYLESLRKHKEPIPQGENSFIGSIDLEFPYSHA